MDYTIEKKETFRVIGVRRRFRFEDSYETIPKFWDEFLAQEAPGICKKLGRGCNVGRYGICVDDVSAEEFEYWIAGDYTGGDVPDGLETWEVPAQTWAKFNSSGALQRVNTRIFKEWLPGNPEWEFAANFNLEVYYDKDVHSEIWIPVRKRGTAE